MQKNEQKDDYNCVDFTLRIPKNLNDKLKLISKMNNRSKSSQILNIINKYLKDK